MILKFEVWLVAQKYREDLIGDLLVFSACSTSPRRSRDASPMNTESGPMSSFAPPYRAPSLFSMKPGKNFNLQSKQRKSRSINLDFLSTNI